jgi:hypothetical protein
MDRREALKQVALITGGTIIGTQAFLSGCKSDSENGVKLLDEIGETIIPTTDTPGAKAAQVGSFMVTILPDFYEEKNQKAFRSGLDKIQKDFEKEYGSAFIEGKPDEKHDFLHKLNQEVFTYSKDKKEEEPDHYFRIMKELTLLGYFTSEIGCTQARRYIQTPGRFDACIDYKPGEPSWT